MEKSTHTTGKAWVPISHVLPMIFCDFFKLELLIKNDLLVFIYYTSFKMIFRLANKATWQQHFIFFFTFMDSNEHKFWFRMGITWKKSPILWEKHESQFHRSSPIFQLPMWSSKPSDDGNQMGKKYPYYGKRMSDKSNNFPGSPPFLFFIQVPPHFFFIYIYITGIHSMQGWTATKRHGVTKKRSTKRLKHTRSLFRKKSQLKGVC